jgi:hypothetical protein
MIVNCCLILAILYDCECCGLNNGASFLGGLLGALDGLDLFEKESPDDSGLDTSSAKDSSIGSGDGFILFGESLVVIGAKLGDAVDSLSAVAAVMGGPGAMAALGDVVDHNA